MVHLLLSLSSSWRGYMLWVTGCIEKMIKITLWSSLVSHFDNKLGHFGVQRTKSWTEYCMPPIPHSMYLASQFCKPVLRSRPKVGSRPGRPCSGSRRWREAAASGGTTSPRWRRNPERNAASSIDGTTMVKCCAIFNAGVCCRCYIAFWRNSRFPPKLKNS